MNTLGSEVRATQNPALGSTLIWQFAVGYSQTHPSNGHPPLPLIFLVLPIVLHEPTLELLQSTQAVSGLRKFTAKFGDAKQSKQDLLLAIHDRAIKWRPMSREALAFALKFRLLAMQMSGVVVPLTTTSPKLGIAADVSGLLKAAHKFGRWCGEVTLHEVAANLRVTF